MDSKNDSLPQMQARLKLEWRRFLTQQLLRAYFSRRAFFNLKLQAAGIDNPDQVTLQSPFLIDWQIVTD